MTDEESAVRNAVDETNQILDKMRNLQFREEKTETGSRIVVVDSTTNKVQRTLSQDDANKIKSELSRTLKEVSSSDGA